MTKRGYFITNGVPRVIINQVIRKPGAYFQESKNKLIKSNKTQINRQLYVDLISHRGTWLRLEIDKRNKIWAKMKKSPRIPVLLLLQTFGINKKTIIQTVLNSNLESDPNILKNKKDSIENLLSLINSKSKNIDEVIENRRKLIYYKFLNARSYYLGKVGRKQLNNKFGLSISTNQTTLTPYDILLTIDSLIQVFKNKKNCDDIDHLENRRVRTSGELIQNQLALGLIRLEKRLVDKIKKDKGFLQLQNVFTPRTLNSVFKEFFGSNPLSQFLDQANPLSELTHKRRLTSIGPGGVSRDTAGMAIRGIHPTHYGRICPIETPEGQNAGLVNSMTTFSSLNKDGSITTPFFLIYKGQIQKQLGVQKIASEFSKRHPILLNFVETSKLNFLSNYPFTIQIDQNFQKVNRKNIKYSIISCLQLISIATSLIPFLEHDDANRALMGSNMQRQAIPLLNSEQPIVGTGFENKVLFYSSNFIQSPQSGLILYSSHKKIILSSFLDINYKKSNERFTREFYKKFFFKYQKSFFKFYYIKYFTFIKYFNYLFQYKTRNNSKNSLFRKNFILNNKKIKIINLKNNIIFLNSNKCIDYLLNKIQIFNFYYISRNIDINCKEKQNFFLQKKVPYIWNTKYLKKGNLIFRNKKPFNITSIKNIYTLPTNKVILHLNSLKNSNIKYISIQNTPKENRFRTELFLLNYTRSNQGTCLVQKPFFKSGYWVEKGSLLTNNLSSDLGELALGKNILVGYLPWEGYNFEDAILINESLIYNDVYTSIHIEKYKIEIRETLFGSDEITKKIPNLDFKSELSLDDRGIIKIGSWIEEGDILVGRITPTQKRNLLPHEKLLYDIVGKDLSSYKNTSLRVPRGIEGRVINIQVFEKKNIFKNSFDSKITSVVVYIAESKKIKIGDKIAGRHGNKGIVSKILVLEDMPYFPDGNCLDMILNPLGVPSRMNIGQIFESLFGLIGKKLMKRFKILPFDEIFGYEASRSLSFFKLYETSLKLNKCWFFSPNFPGKFKIFDGRTGINFTYPIMSGFSYMMKLIHLVDEKIHARSTGSYSLVTQQPLRGRSKHGGQRFGEMEVWALEGFGVAYTLQELLTVKSDDVKGRTQILETVLKHSTLYFGTPESFKVLIRELQALCLDVKIDDRNIKYYFNF